ncbi:hypothetical protein GQ54DRAFT_298408 [Martensiomyces pterosporus]|nr:hypothetical protein GQ54DRAFT_298408 [Martensiomyces pterosporus]
MPSRPAPMLQCPCCCICNRNSDATIEEACDALIQHSIQSVPLYDAASKSYVGMFDLHDLATYILSRRGNKSGSESITISTGSSPSPLAREALGGGRGDGEPVSKISDMSHMNPFYSVLPETTVAQIAGVFASGTHRVAVMESERVIRGILSQTRIIRYFFEQCGSISPELGNGVPDGERALLDKSLRELGLVTNNVVMAKPSTPVIQALSLLERWHISSIAIVEDNQRLVGNLSVTDVKYLVKEKHLINGTCIELIQAVRFWQGMKDGRDRAAVFSVRPEASLRYALTKLIATGAHRVWVTAPPSSSAVDNLSPDAIAAANAAATITGAASRQRSGSTASIHRRASVSSTSSQTVPIAPPSYAGAFSDVVCGVVSLTDVLRLLIENSPKPTADPEYNYASMD